MAAAVIIAAIFLLPAACTTEKREPRPWEPETEIDIADGTFLSYCLEHFDFNGDGLLTNYEARAVSVINVSRLGISSLEGIEHFVNLQRLDCSGNDIGRLDLNSNTHLVELDCSDCGLTELLIEECKKLQSLDCSYNASLPAALDLLNQPAMLSLDCSYSGVRELVIRDSVMMMEQLYMDGCQAPGGTRDFRKYIRLKELSLRDNGLSGLVTDSLVSLERLYFSANDKLRGTLSLGPLQRLKHLEVNDTFITGIEITDSPGIDTLICSGNHLSQPDFARHRRLVYLDCSGNRIERLDLTGFGRLIALDCRDNLLDTLGLGADTLLRRLVCSGNRITPLLDISDCYSLEEFDCTGNTPPDLEIIVRPGFDPDNENFRKDPQATYVEKPEEPDEPDEPEEP